MSDGTDDLISVEELVYALDCDDEDGRDCCPHCGKPYEEFSDLGCGYCDVRSPNWGIV